MPKQTDKNIVEGAGKIEARSSATASGKVQTALERELELAKELGISREIQDVPTIRTLMEDTAKYLEIPKAQIAHKLYVKPQAINSWEQRNFIPKQNFSNIREGFDRGTPLRDALENGTLNALQRHVAQYLKVLNEEDTKRRREMAEKSRANSRLGIAALLPLLPESMKPNNEKAKAIQQWREAKMAIYRAHAHQIEVSKQTIETNYDEKKLNFWRWFGDENKASAYKPLVRPFFENEHVAAEYCTMSVSLSTNPNRPLRVEAPRDFHEALLNLLCNGGDYFQERWLYIVVPYYLLEDRSQHERDSLETQALGIIKDLEKTYIKSVQRLFDEHQIFGFPVEDPQQAHKPQKRYSKVEIKVKTVDSLEDVVFELCDADAKHERYEEEMWEEAMAQEDGPDYDPPF